MTTQNFPIKFLARRRGWLIGSLGGRAAWSEYGRFPGGRAHSAAGYCRIGCGRLAFIDTAVAQRPQNTGHPAAAYCLPAR
mgnify:CR=1